MYFQNQSSFSKYNTLATVGYYSIVKMSLYSTTLHISYQLTFHSKPNAQVINFVFNYIPFHNRDIRIIEQYALEEHASTVLAALVNFGIDL
mmetsp:Transcript_29698/g.50643  ORF Transcript_29698/g.50643 Transcript_29698/m.50643 type:complete len:91 (-) Transcript_29698:339-611(-)